jgi:hypothetical protein
LGRAASTTEREQEVPVLKDLDFIEDKMAIHIGKEKGELLIKQVNLIWQ